MKKIIVNSKAEIVTIKFNHSDIIIIDVSKVIINDNISIDEIFDICIGLSDKFLGIALVGLYSQENIIFDEVDKWNTEIDKFCQENNFIFLDYDYYLIDNNNNLKDYIEANLTINYDYNFFAQIYQDLQDDIEYQKWIDIINSHIDDYDTLVDISCGSAPYAKLFAKDKYIGIDLSNEMIEIAKKSNPEYHFEVNDMLKYHVKSDVIVSILDGINYLTRNQLPALFENINRNLNPNGIAVIDIHDDREIAKFDEYFFNQNYNEGVFTWESKIIDNKLIHLFTYEENERFLVEKHIQTIYRKNEIEEIVNENNLKVVKWYNIYDHNVVVLERN